MRLFQAGGGGGGAAAFKGAKVHRNTTTAAISLTNATGATVGFDLSDFDTSSFWSGGAPTKFTIPTAGKYLIQARITYAGNAAGARAATIWKNGVGGAEANRLAHGNVFPNEATDVPAATASCIVNLAQNDFVEVQAYQTSGGTLATYTTSPDAIWPVTFEIAYLGA